MSEQPEAKQVPLVERLESVPVDARLAVDDGPYSTSYYPVGAMAHEAAAELRRLHSVNAELLGALKWIDRRCPKHLLDSDPHKIHREAAYDAGASARAAIAKAEEVKP